MPSIWPGESEKLSTSLAEMTMYSVAASERQTGAPNNKESSSDIISTTTAATTTVGTDGSSDETAGNRGDSVDIPTDFMKSADADGNICVSVSWN